MAVGVSVTLSSVTAADATFSVDGAAAWLTVKDRTADASLTGFGTNVESALAVNVGSAGAVVVNGGSLGTPSSGVATNLTGTAAGLTAGTASAVAVGGITGLGTNVATALAVNIGSAGAPVLFNGALGTPSSGTGTNITGVNAATLGGATFAAPGPVGSGTPSTGSFTTLAATGLLSLSAFVVTRATVDQSITSNTTLASATNMSFSIGASEEWVADFFLDIGTNMSNHGIQLAVTVPASATLNVIAAVTPNSVATTAANTQTNAKRSTTSGEAMDFTATASSSYGFGLFHVSVWVLNSTNAGTVQLQIAQSTSSGTALTIRKGSHMTARRIA